MTEWKLPHLTLDITGLLEVEKAPNLTDVPKESFEKYHEALQAKYLSKQIGFFDWPNLVSTAHYEQIRDLAKRLRDDFDGVIIFGIGGSYLGPMAVADAMEFPAGDADLNVWWVSNIDSPEIRRVEREIQGKKIAAVVTSKSGNTVETLSAFFHFYRYLEKDSVVVITDPISGELRRLAKENQWPTLEVPPNVGGRFSVLTDVGLFPTMLLGLSAERLVQGALAMRKELTTLRPSQNPAYLYAWLLHEWDKKGKSNQYLMPYQRNLKYLADWYVQLFAESLGKPQKTNADTRVGPTPVSALGTSDQHSQLQLFKEGPRNKVVGFIDIFSSDMGLKVHKTTLKTPAFDYLFKHTFDEISHFALVATQNSLKNSQVPTYRVMAEAVDETFLGAFFFFFQTACAFAGELYQVDAYNQPGVEEAKRLLRDAL